MRILRRLFALALMTGTAFAAVPVFTQPCGDTSCTLVGADPNGGETTVIPVLLVPVSLSFEAKTVGGKAFTLDAGSDVPAILQSPVFSAFAFPNGGTTQYADALLRTAYSHPEGWHTLLGKPEVRPAKITVPVGSGYVLTSKKSGGAVAIVDSDFLQNQLLRSVGPQPGKLILAVTENVAYYAAGDATICCSWGTHGVDSATGNSFVLASYLHEAPAVVADKDIQPLTEQLAEFVTDPFHDPLLNPEVARIAHKTAPGNRVPAWVHPETEGGCGGTGIATDWFLLEPTDTNPKNNFPASPAFLAQTGDQTWHLQNVALLPWYTGQSTGLRKPWSFPDPEALPEAAQPCPARHWRHERTAPLPAVTAVPSGGAPNGHQLIGYWSGYDVAGFPPRDISPQWDVIIVAFATPDSHAPEGTLRFRTPPPLDTAQFKSDLRWLKSRGSKVLISLGGGGEYFTLADARNIPNFVNSVTRIVAEYGFDGVDIDFETPSLVLDRGDTDFRHPTTPSVVNLIAGLRQLREHFGPGFMISLVPEGPQIPAASASYGGQFGSYLPIAWGLRDILSFMDVQDYNTPPVQGLDGEIYQAGSVDYHAAVTELVLHGFDVGGRAGDFFPPLPADKVAIGFLIGETTPEIVNQAVAYIVTGTAPAGTSYRLRKPDGYPEIIGAMFWTIDADRADKYAFSNSVGPRLHAYSAAEIRALRGSGTSGTAFREP